MARCIHCDSATVFHPVPAKFCALFEYFANARDHGNAAIRHVADGNPDGAWGAATSAAHWGYLWWAAIDALCEGDGTDEIVSQLGDKLNMPKIPPLKATEPRRRHFLKLVTVQKGALTATFANGETTDSRDAASFFQMMDDRNKTIEDVEDAIFIGRQCDPFKDWREIQRIADSFGGTP